MGDGGFPLLGRDRRAGAPLMLLPLTTHPKCEGAGGGACSLHNRHNLHRIGGLQHGVILIVQYPGSYNSRPPSGKQVGGRE